jgi:hypothetical protein
MMMTGGKLVGIYQRGQIMSSVLGAFGSIRDVLSLVSKLGMSNIGKLIELVKQIGDDNLDVKTRVLAAIEAGDIVADFTATPADDLVVQFLRNAANEEGLWKLVEIVGYLVEGKGIPVGAMPEDGIQVGKAGDEKGFIPIPVMIQLAQVIATILMGLRNK